MSENKERQIYNSCDPLLDAGQELHIKLSQSLKEGTTDRLQLTGADTVKLRIEGPQIRIDPTYIAGVFPAPGSTETPDEYLPHVALNRRTLPWERPGPIAGAPWMALLLVKSSEMQQTWRRVSRPYGLKHIQAIERGGVTLRPDAVKGATLQTPAAERLRPEIAGQPGRIEVGPVVQPGPVFEPGPIGQPGPIQPIAVAGSLEDITVGAIKARDERTWQQLRNVVKLSDSTQVFAAFIPNKVLASILPLQNELALLTHMKRVWKKGKAEDTSIVICNRLPDAGDGNNVEEHTALLVSLEGRADLWEANRLSNANKATALVVLHHWSFKPSGAGDFEELMHAIGLRPNGGVLRFGNLPAEARHGGLSLSGGFGSAIDKDGYFPDHVQHEQAGVVDYRGPLRPFPAPARVKGFAVRAAPEEFSDTPGLHDYSHAAAFELGRLLGMADSEIREEMRDIGTVPDRLPEKEWVNQLPPMLQKPDWVMNDDWFEQPWEMPGQQLLRTELQHQTQFGVADVTALEHKGAAWKNQAIDAIKNAPANEHITVIDVAFENINIEVLEELAIDVINVAQP